MTICAIVPVRSLADGKRRLAGAMDDAQRAALNERFLVHALGLAAALPGPTILVSPDPAVAAHPAAGNAVRVVDPGRGLNAAIEAGRDRARRAGVERIVVLPTDLPTARRDDVLALAAAAEARSPSRPTGGGRAPTGCPSPPGSILRSGSAPEVSRRISPKPSGSAWRPT